MHSRIIALIILIPLIFFPVISAATHLVGIDLRMVCQNSCTTRMEIRAYRDCTGSPIIANNLTFAPLISGCQMNPLTNWSVQQIMEVTPLCPTTTTRCTDPNAVLNGIEEYSSYRDYDVCNPTNPAFCSWEYGWDECCRNSNITSGAANMRMTVNSTYSTLSACNNSPVFTNTPLFYTCINVPTSIQMGAVDPDGDSLAYSLDSCYSNSNGVTYNPGYSPTSPLGPNWLFSLDPSSGLMGLVPNPGSPEVGVVCITTSEYRNGVLIGRSVRDIQIGVVTCSPNTAPVINLSNLSAGATLSGDTIDICGGVPLSFQLSVTDPDTASGQSLMLLWDQSAPGATFTESGNPLVLDTVSGNAPIGTFSWNSPTSGFHSIIFGARDDNCPLITYVDKVYYVRVNGNANIPIQASSLYLDTCSANPVPVTLSLPGGPYPSYQWSTGAVTPSIQVSQPGNYMVTVTSINCPLAMLSGSVNVDQTPPHLSGTVTRANGTLPLENSRVYLITHDPILNTLTAIDTTLTDSTGYYEFPCVLADTVYLKAAPDSNWYPSYLPTYADTSIYWNNAIPIATSNNPITKDWSVIPGVNPGGPGFVGGYILQGANKTSGPGDPISYMRVFLYRIGTNAFVGSTFTDSSGYFLFNTIPLGDYKVSVDVPGVDELNTPLISLGQANSGYDSLLFHLHSSYLELVVPSFIASGLESDKVHITPNPGGLDQILTIELQNRVLVEAMIYDLSGKLLGTLVTDELGPGDHKLTLPAVVPGTYFIRVQIGNDPVRILRLIKM